MIHKLQITSHSTADRRRSASVRAVRLLPPKRLACPGRRHRRPNWSQEQHAERRLDAATRLAGSTSCAASPLRRWCVLPCRERAAPAAALAMPGHVSVGSAPADADYG